MKLTQTRQELAALIRLEVDDNTTVIDSLPDSITPPAVLVAWGNPWLAPSTYCLYTGNIELLIVAARIEPGGQYETIESLVTDLLVVLNPSQYSIRDVTSPYPLQLGGVDYLAASINIEYEIEE